jgi:hypothetical protein
MIIVLIVQQNPYDDFTVEAAKTQGKKQGITASRLCSSCWIISAL